MIKRLQHHNLALKVAWKL